MCLCECAFVYQDGTDLAEGCVCVFVLPVPVSFCLPHIDVHVDKPSVREYVCVCVCVSARQAEVWGCGVSKVGRVGAEC